MDDIFDQPVVAGAYPVGSQPGPGTAKKTDDAPGVVDDGVPTEEVAVVPFFYAFHFVFQSEVGGHGFYLGLGEAKAVFNFRLQQCTDPGIVKVAEYTLLGNFQYADYHDLFQVGVVLEGLHHEAADEGDHMIVVSVHMGRMQEGVILIEKDVWGGAVGAVEPEEEVFDGLGAVVVGTVSVQYSGKQFFIGLAQHSAIL